jgi:hypothetical protein
MQNLSHKSNELHIKLNVEELTPTQIRLIKNLNSLMALVLTAEDEPEYFENAAQLMKKTAEIIKHSSFAENCTTMSYGEQAVEFAVDYLNEQLDEQKISNIDN